MRCLSVTVKTPETAPVIAPRHVSGGGGKVGTLTITWEVNIHIILLITFTWEVKSHTYNLIMRA